MARRVEPPRDANGKTFVLEAGERLDPVRERYTIANRLIYRAVAERLFSDPAARARLDEVRASGCAAMAWNGKAATDALVAAVIEIHGAEPEAAARSVAGAISRACETRGEGIAKVTGPTARAAASAVRKTRVTALRRHRR